jgi:hypothetical protein
MSDALGPRRSSDNVRYASDSDRMLRRRDPPGWANKRHWLAYSITSSHDLRHRG